MRCHKNVTAHKKKQTHNMTFYVHYKQLCVSGVNMLHAPTMLLTLISAEIAVGSCTNFQ